ncbi:MULTISPECIES: SMI1/KNR4 family protein [Streptomyces]|uniref:SMI1/KNR4 family protein n=1 Tax=Streptomyces mutomycini TaxID=284036 RepID=A0ABW0B428_9ACTN|nr:MULTISPECIES: SMI1/KNR4 family protein [Streptomyces]
MARFDEVRATFWEDGRHGVRPALTDEAVREAESVLGVALPADLLVLLRARNGGVVSSERDAFPTTRPTSWSESHVPFDELTGIGEHAGMTSLLDSAYLVEEWGLPSPIVLLSGDGHTWIALDYRSCGPYGEPSVTWFDVERDEELALAPDFRSFVEGLTSEGTFDVPAAPGPAQFRA